MELLVLKRDTLLLSLLFNPDGFILPPMTIFRGKTNQAIKDIEAPKGFVIVTQEKAWMDESLLFIWFDQVWKSYAEKNPKRIGF